MTRYFLLVLLFVFTGCKSVGAMVIVRDGKANASIVIPVNASAQVKNAALILQQYIQRATAANLPVTTNATGPAIYVGNTDYAKQLHLPLQSLDEDGYIIQSGDEQHFVILGGSDWGTEFGVYEFLERFLGVRWIMPSEQGTIIGNVKTLELPATKVLENPVFKSRELSPLTITANTALGRWGRFNRARGRIQFHHNLNKIFAPSRFARTHPEFYPLINGQRMLPSDDKEVRWQPNFTAPGVIDTAANEILSYFKANPDAKTFSLGLNDSDNFNEKGSVSKKNLFGFEDRSDEYFRWANAVVQKVSGTYPDKVFGTLAYNNVAEPPTNVKVAKGIVPFLCYERMRWANDKLRSEGEDLTKRWLQQAPELGWYDYDYGFAYLVPRVWFHEMQDYLKWGAAHNVKYYYAELYPDWAEGPKTWVTTKLLWNPNRNVDSLLNVYYKAAVGSAAAPKLQAFYALWEKYWTKDIYNSAHADWYMVSQQYLPFSDLSYLADVPDSYLSQSDDLLTAAAQLAQTSQQKFIAGKIQETWNYFKCSVTAYKANKGSSDNLAAGLKAVDDRQQSFNRIKSDSTMYIAASILAPHQFGGDWKGQMLARAGNVSKNNTMQQQMRQLAGSDNQQVRNYARAYLNAGKGNGKLVTSNPSFEDEMKGWTPWLADPSQGKYLLSTDEHTSGNKSLLVTGIKRGGPNQTIAYVPGTYYASASCYVPADYKSGNATISIQILDATGKQTTDSSLLPPPLPVNLVAGKWSNSKLPFTLPEGNNGYKVRLVLILDGFMQNNKIYIDDLGIYKTDNK